jgi:hypothetical protein
VHDTTHETKGSLRIELETVQPGEIKGQITPMREAGFE